MFLYSEDLQHGQQIGSLRIVNPYRPMDVHEPNPTYGPAESASGSVDALLRRAIREKRQISVEYDGLRRVGEPLDCDTPTRRHLNWDKVYASVTPRVRGRQTGKRQ
jgi:hypothetical protein